MRVLMFSHSSAVENFGGAERAMLEFLDAWREVDPNVDLFVVSRAPEGHLQPELDRRQIPWMNLQFQSWVLPRRLVDPEDLYRETRASFTAVRALELFIREFRPDVVITNTIVTPWAALAAKLVGVPHVWFAHEFGSDHEFMLTREQTFTDIGLLSDLVVTSSEALRDHLAAWINAVQLDVLYPIPDFAKKDPVRSRGADGQRLVAAGANALNLVCVGRVSETKGQSQVVRAVGLLKKRGVRVGLVLVGAAGAEEQDNLHRVIDESGIEDQVVITGEVENPYPYIIAADVGVVASAIEGFGRSTVETMAMGRPVIAARGGATVELLDERVGSLYEAGDIEDLASKIGEYAKNETLPSLRGAAAKSWVQRELLQRHPRARTIARIQRIARGVSSPVQRLPNLVVSWLTLPRVAMEMFSAWEIMPDGHQVIGHDPPPQGEVDLETRRISQSATTRSGALVLLPDAATPLIAKILSRWMQSEPSLEVTLVAESGSAHVRRPEALISAVESLNAKRVRGPVDIPSSLGRAFNELNHTANIVRHALPLVQSSKPQIVISGVRHAEAAEWIATATGIPYILIRLKRGAVCADRGECELVLEERKAPVPELVLDEDSPDVGEAIKVLREIIAAGSSPMQELPGILDEWLRFFEVADGVASDYIEIERASRAGRPEELPQSYA